MEGLDCRRVTTGNIFFAAVVYLECSGGCYVPLCFVRTHKTVTKITVNFIY